MRAQIILAFGLTLSTSVQAQPSPEPKRDDEYIRQLLLSAADQALQDQINLLFSVWMRSTEDQPRRALVGAHQAVNAYRDIVKALESRDWKIVAPPEPQAKLFPPSIPETPHTAPLQRERLHHGHRHR